MSPTPTPTTRAAHGWGFQTDAATPQEADGVIRLLAVRFGADAVWSAPLPPPAPAGDHPVSIPVALQAILTDDVETRRHHAVGRSFTDLVALRETGVTQIPDLVACPSSPQEVADVLGWCTDIGLTCIPFGGGTSVVGGVTPPAGDQPVLSMQLRAMDRVVEVDQVSRAALIQAGATGPVLEQQLRRHDLTMRFFPQSFEMSTLGGWIATRAGGHYATGPVHIDDLVQAIDAQTPAGRWESRRLPGSGAGPSPDRLLLGSEGTLGVITSAWVRLQDRPRFKASTAIRFATFAAALQALRPLVQSGLRPSNCRILDPTEAALSGAGDGSLAVMMVAAESATVDVQHDMAAMVQLLADHGGKAAAAASGESPNRPAVEQTRPDQTRPDQIWRASFLRAPYLRDAMVDAGMIIETFETATTFDRLDTLVHDVMRVTTQAVTEICGDGIVTCRITHAYPDGAAPYFTVIAPGRRGARVEQWRQIKSAASQALIDAGGTITHHHAVGRDHRPWYDQQRPDLFAQALGAVKQHLDPAGILNPGVLLG
ncbi:MAG: FAD-binding oxidoreductase [Euzebya sp.]